MDALEPIRDSTSQLTAARDSLPLYRGHAKGDVIILDSFDSVRHEVKQAKRWYRAKKAKVHY